MKKKGFNRVLLIVVAFIWLFVFRKAFNFYDEKSEKIEASNDFETAYIRPIEFIKDTFEIQKYGRDPFLDNYKRKKVVPVKNVKQKKTVAQKSRKNKKVTTVKWPKLQYFGYIKGGSEKKKLALLKINGKLYRIRERDEIDEIYVRRVYKDSLIVERHDELKTIKK